MEWHKYPQTKPPKEGSYLCCVSSGAYKTVCSAYYKDHLVPCGMTSFTPFVTHWAELPTPPKD